MNDLANVEAAIRQLHARYADAVWRKDLEAFGDCFTDEAQWRIGGAVVRGRAVIVEHMRGVFLKFRRILVSFHTPIVTLDTGAVSARTYLTEQSVLADGRAFAPIGTYFERFAGEGDRYRFAWRLFQTQYAGPPDLSGSFFDNPDFGPPPAMPPLDAPTFNYTGLHAAKE